MFLACTPNKGRTMLMSIVCTATLEHAESVVPTESRGHVDTYSLVLPESMWKSMIHAATDSEGQGSYF